MPKLLTAIPKYRKHARDVAFVEVCGKRTYLPGRYGSSESRQAYRRFLAEWEVHSRQEPIANASDLTVTELAARFWTYAKRYYTKNGWSTGTAENYRPMIQTLRKLYGTIPAAEFKPLAAKALIREWVNQGLCRRYVNDHLHRLKRLFKWGVSEDLIPATVYQALATVEGERKGHSDAKDNPPVEPVADEVVEATLPHLPPIVADMVQLCRLTGCRSGELCQMRPIDIDRRGKVWRFTPLSHKTEHHGKQRVVCIGPKAQSILAKYLLRDSEAYCFVPAESAEGQRRKRTLARKTPLSCGNGVGSKRKLRRQRAPGGRYSNDTFRRAITRGCKVAFKMPEELRKIPAKGRVSDAERNRLRLLAAGWRAQHVWHPHQLRHASATEVRNNLGLEHAQHYLGHSRADITQIYTARNLALAEDAALRLG